MRKSLWWSAVLALAVLFCLAITTDQVAFAQSGATITTSTGVTYAPSAAKARRPGIPDANGVGQLGREWEGIASTDYLTFEASQIWPANPDIAVGPSWVLTIVNRTILAYPNPNAPGINPPSGTGAAAVTYPWVSRNFLTQWIGEAALSEVCPTLARGGVATGSCVIDNATVRYDQMQGRYVVLFTATDVLHRKASWVLIVSRWADFNVGTPGTTDIFTTPAPPGPTQSNVNSGGVNTNWYIYYGSIANAATKQPLDGLCPAGGCLYGNINQISDLDNAQVFANHVTIDCTPDAILAFSSAGENNNPVCYFPTSARLGLDNDNIIVVSSVYNDNIPTQPDHMMLGKNLANQRALLRTAGVTPPRTPAAVGTRVRVFKKAAVYTAVSSKNGTTAPALVPGAAMAAPQIQGDYYDLWTRNTVPTTPVFPNAGRIHYTVDPYIEQTLCRGTCVAGVAPVVRWTPALNYEPVHLRGRALATFSGRGNLDNGFTNLLGAVSTADTQSDENLRELRQRYLYLRTITYSLMKPGTLPVGAPPTVNTPLITGGIPTLQGQTVAPESVQVPPFRDAVCVNQRNKLTQPDPNNINPTPCLYVGDDRPHRVVAREGHLYVARVADQTELYNRVDGTNANAALYSSVLYDIVQKLAYNNTPFEVLNTLWQNGRYFAPMFDVPANVIQYGSISPVNMLPYFDKLFVGTTFPPLSAWDSRPSSGVWPFYTLNNPTGPCKGQEPSVTFDRTRWAYPSLFDIRCGEDAYDTVMAYRNSVSGLIGSTWIDAYGVENSMVPWGIRGGASTDPVNLSLWLFGAYAKGRASQIGGYGQWGTYVANYPLTIPAVDPYNNEIRPYADVPRDHPHALYVQVARQTEIEPGARYETNFMPNDNVRRREMARWVVRAQMDEAAITAYLAATGGATFSSFADVPVDPGPTGSACNPGAGKTPDPTCPYFKYIEVMYRRGYTKGCAAISDTIRQFCPADYLTRGQMAVFLIRAKMNSVFPTVTSGVTGPGTPANMAGACATGIAVAFGDLYGVFSPGTPYFEDVQCTAGNIHPYYNYIQKMRELRITAGTTATTYSPDQNLTRSEIATFIVRAFFP